ncbi:MAG: hypothetical protein ACQEXJ_06810 [Myxococcota bacterium]
MHDLTTRLLLLSLAAGLAWGCDDDPAAGAADAAPDVGVADVATTPDAGDDVDTAGDTLEDAGSDATAYELPPPPEDDGIHGYAHACVAVQGFDGFDTPRTLAVSDDGAAYAFAEEGSPAESRFRMQAADLGTFLLYDAEEHYLTAVPDDDGGWRFERAARLESSLERMDDAWVSRGEWNLEASARDPERYHLRNRASGRYLTLAGLAENVDDAAIVTLLPREGCATFPELTLDATGTVTPRTFEDGDLYGIAEIHSHILTNFGFGGGSIFHGAPFHRLGVEHALPDCTQWHGEEGRRDIVGYFYEGNVGFEVDALLPIVAEGQVDEFNHHTEGYPHFTTWPDVRDSTTHQAMYHRWIERAWMGGLRLMVQLATGNSVLCDLVIGTDAQDVRYSCNDMVSVDRQIAEVRNMERYIDAQSGGPGKGWFRVVETPAEAREVIAQGKMAVVLGIEISNLLDCFSTPKEGFETCTPDLVRERLDHYRDLGIRVIFPVHKYDNAFSAGDGSGGIIELGNFVNTGHNSAFVQDCPGVSTTFDKGGVTFGDLNEPREHYDDPPPHDLSDFGLDLVGTIFPHLDAFTGPSLPGDWCQKFGLTPLGETLLHEMMARGMIIDVAHLPQRALARAYEILEAAGYPATKTHGDSNGGRLYELGGMTGAGFGGCGHPDQPGGMVQGFKNSVEQRLSHGAYPSEALGFDMNGFAGGRGPRFGEDRVCSGEQANPVGWPFDSWDGDVTFLQPQLGERTVDYNTEGLLHIGLLPELLEEVRLDGATDEELEPLFRSAEAYVRLWEKAESLAAPRAR